MIIKLQNKQLYEIAEYYTKYFKSSNEVYFPAKLNYCINKNFKKVLLIAQEIDNIRRDVIKRYGVEQSDGDYVIDAPNIPIAQKELDDLANLEQEIDIIPISLSELDKIKLTPAQFEAMEFMINTNEIEES